MNRPFLFCLIFLLLIFQVLISAAQPHGNVFFGKTMPIGAYYYPEHWSEGQWGRDLGRMADLGFSFTHFGEFAWANMEPQEGEYDFAWLDKAVELAANNGLKVILCTPTPTPPAWLTEKHPEILLVSREGITQQHGSRLHINAAHPVYLEYVRKIVTELGKRYGQDERIWGWQLDNEPHLGTLYDYSAGSQQAFREWLQTRYDTIQALNRAWGTAFWSQSYNAFDQIKIPNPKAAPQGANPHALTDFQRFTADQIASFLRFQANVLDPLVSDDQFITTNYAYYKFLPSIDLFRNQEDLDFASHTMYLTSTFLNSHSGDLAHRLGSGMELSFSAELSKSINGYTGIMELQPGQINWGAYNAQPLPSAVRMWIWHSFGLGDKFVCTYRFRQPLFGGEQFHKGIMETDGVTVAPGGEEYVQAIQEINALKPSSAANKQIPAGLASRRTAFLWKQDNLFDLINASHTQRWDTWQHYYTYYEGLKTLGAPVTFIQEDDPFDPEEFPFLVAPTYVQVDSALIAKWKKYVEQGGNLILSARTGQKDVNGHLWEMLLQEPVWDLIGAKIRFNDQLSAEQQGTVGMDGKSYPWSVWAEVLEILPPDNGSNQARVLASYADQFYAGSPAVVTHRHGKGTVTYLGVWSVDSELERSVLRQVYLEAGAEILDLPRYVFTEWRDGYWVTVNYTSDAVDAPVPAQASIIYGDRSVLPGEVCVWTSGQVNK